MDIIEKDNPSTLSSAEAPHSTGESHAKRNKRFSAQKSRFLACATTTTVQTQEGAMHMAGSIMERRVRAERGVALTGLEL